MGTSLNLFTVWDKDVPYLTSRELPEEVATKLGFGEFIPKGEDLVQRQFCIERPHKKQLPTLLGALSLCGIDATILPYEEEQSTSLGWEPWEGFTFGYRPNAEMQKIAEQFIREDADHKHLAAARIKYVYVRGNTSVDEDTGQYTIAYVQSANRLAKNLGKWDFLMCTYEGTWDVMNDEQKRRIVDHELFHLTFKEGGPAMRDHNIQEFKEMHLKYSVPFGEDIYSNAHATVKAIIEAEEEEDADDEGDEE